MSQYTIDLGSYLLHNQDIEQKVILKIKLFNYNLSPESTFQS